MLLSMTQDQFHKGLNNILTALESTLAARGVKNALVENRTGSAQPQDVEFAVSANGRTETQKFVREEIEDSGEAIDAPVALKVRMLVSHFVGG
jgi:hypothetical protein